MESALTRKAALERWTAANVPEVCSILALPHDASFRRYYRIQTTQASYLVMDAPPQLENTQPFIAISQALRALALQTPEIIAADSEQGFLLITDFGNLTYLNALNAGNADELYQRALQALAVLQTCEKVAGHTLPIFSYDFMQKEWLWHKEWFAQKWLNLDLTTEPELDACYEHITKQIAAQPQVFMHRDYHAGNLMVLEQDQDIGILDFQDAFLGPITYDVVSLLRDCYIDWPEERLLQWLEFYYALLRARGQLSSVSFAEFQRWFDWMGLQRHLKALMTFARKQVRDQQSGYLHHIPRTLNYLLKVAGRYPELAALREYLERVKQCVR